MVLRQEQQPLALQALLLLPLLPTLARTDQEQAGRLPLSLRLNVLKLCLALLVYHPPRRHKISNLPPRCIVHGFTDVNA